jgi:glycosyltransferase involved in cell wall biosynthesis
MPYDFSHWKSLPSISCQCITYGRTSLLNEAVECFLRQDYPGVKELVILNDHPGMRIECGVPGVKVVNLDERMANIGMKRNECVKLCSGDVIFPWDDDDISLPHRISYSISRMTNHRYYKADKIWYWRNGEIGKESKKAVAHAMGCFSKEFFDEVGGYPEIDSGQDQGLEKRFEGPHRVVEDIAGKDIYYIYKFPGTGSYHLSAYGYGKGFEQVGKYVGKAGLPDKFTITPAWSQDYPRLCADILLKTAAAKL